MNTLLTIFRLPSDIVFFALTSPTNYENALVRLRNRLDEVDTITSEFDDFEPIDGRYCMSVSNSFSRFAANPTNISDAKLAVNRELCKVHPTIYYWDMPSSIAVIMLTGFAVMRGYGLPIVYGNLACFSMRMQLYKPAKK